MIAQNELLGTYYHITVCVKHFQMAACGIVARIASGTIMRSYIPFQYMFLLVPLQNPISVVARNDNFGALKDELNY